MRAFLTIFLTLILSLLLSMALAIYLPFNDVNRMFMAGLSVPLLFPLIWVYMLTVERKWVRVSTYSIGIPGLFVLVYLQLAGPLGLT